ncbi:hypothetical protein [Terribacillus sp. JSM ZJ617]|uniref:hypothetical protein n=1 Tax=Terribacillus sp. JSM ZJ617 TaxID=3342119 RepID=UPI0035A8B6C0
MGVWEEIFKLIGSTATVIAILTFLGRQGIQGYINLVTQKSLSNYKYELDKIAREKEHDLQRKIHDFGLYSTKRHEKYSEAFRLLHIAYSSALKVVEIKNLNEYLEMHGNNWRSLLNYLHIHDMDKESINKIIYARENFQFKKTMTDNLVLVKYKEPASVHFNNAESYIFQNELYFSSEVEGLAQESSIAIKALFTSKNSCNDSSDNGDDAYNKLEELKEKMKQEMSVGYYENTPSN